MYPHMLTVFSCPFLPRIRLWIVMTTDQIKFGKSVIKIILLTNITSQLQVHDKRFICNH